MKTNTTNHSSLKPADNRVLRSSGLAAITAGVIFAGIQPIHPPDFLPSLTTIQWTIIMSLKLVMCFLFLYGINGIYIKQSKKMGWAGLAGCIIFSLNWVLQSGYVFTELLILPRLAPIDPEFVKGFLTLANNLHEGVDMGAIRAVYVIAGILYLLGGTLFGIATFRAKVFPQWPAALLAVTAIVTPVAALLPHAIQRLAAIPMGLAFILLGYALWSDPFLKNTRHPDKRNIQ